MYLSIFESECWLYVISYRFSPPMILVWLTMAGELVMAREHAIVKYLPGLLS